MMPDSPETRIGRVERHRRGVATAWSLTSHMMSQRLALWWWKLVRLDARIDQLRQDVGRVSEGCRSRSGRPPVGGVCAC